ncbi:MULTISPECIES: LysR family transcriptional regulator [Comamonas]|uniref:LysR family transcriptional regulator n=1 Tax=Comamonas TaxID=283 RepID=UPI000E0ADE7B|nr:MULTISPECIES: LysR family transcriptional regulator [Comamonas]RDI10866.1 LysR family transcriptional regulator [Comamonas sp. AG1104]
MALSSDDISLFLAVIDQGSFTGAARTLHRVPSAVSMGIGNIEAELGYPLFDRSHREAVPTSQAMALVPQARTIASSLRLLQVHAVQLSQNLESTLSIAVATGIKDTDLLDAVTHIGTRYPSLRIDLRRAPQDRVRTMLHQEGIDLALMTAPTQSDREEARVAVGNETFVAVASAAVDTSSLPMGLPTDLRRLEELSTSRQIVLADPDHSITDLRLLISDNRWHVDSVETAIDLVHAGAGWANLPESAIQTAVNTGKLRILKFDNTRNGVPLPVHLVWLRRRPLGRAAEELVELMHRSHR